MAIIANLPYNFTNGTTADASQVMQNFNQIVNNVNTNAAQLALTPQLASENVFTQPQQMSDPTKPAHAVTLNYATNNIGFLGSANTWTKNNVFSGGIDITPIGQTTAATGKFTSLNANTASTINVTGALTWDIQSSNAQGCYIRFFDVANNLQRGWIGYGPAVVAGSAIGDIGIAPANGTIRFGNSGGASTVATIDGNGINGPIGQTTPAAGSFTSLAASQGIKLNGGTTALNAYEEGTFTPTLAGSTTAGSNTYTNQNGTYTRIGRLVIAKFFLTLSAKDAAMAGSVEVKGLPYTSNATASTYCEIGAANASYVTLPSGASYFYWSLAPNTNYAILACGGSNIAGAAVASSAIASNTTLSGTIVYNI